MKKFTVIVNCSAVCSANIDVPDTFTDKQSLQFAQVNIDNLKFKSVDILKDTKQINAEATIEQNRYYMLPDKKKKPAGDNYDDDDFFARQITDKDLHLSLILGLEEKIKEMEKELREAWEKYLDELRKNNIRASQQINAKAHKFNGQER